MIGQYGGILKSVVNALLVDMFYCVIMYMWYYCVIVLLQYIMILRFNRLYFLFLLQLLRQDRGGPAERLHTHWSGEMFNTQTLAVLYRSTLQRENNQSISSSVDWQKIKHQRFLESINSFIHLSRKDAPTGLFHGPHVDISQYGITGLFVSKITRSSLYNIAHLSLYTL